MFSFIPSLDPRVAAKNLATILVPQLDPLLFHGDIHRLRGMFHAYLEACPPPWPAPNLSVTPEINYQSELWLPLAQIKPVFERFYRAALTFPPILSSSPFSNTSSWAAMATVLPPFCGNSVNPSVLLEQLLYNAELRTKFLCWSFMPRRFYGSGSDRYPAQTDYVREWLGQRKQKKNVLRCLDVACGDGSATYGLVRLIQQQGNQTGRYVVEGWSLDPLEVWAAAHACFPHDTPRQIEFRVILTQHFSAGLQRGMVFRSMDLEGIHSGHAPTEDGAGFDLIICNGLLGGPIIHQPYRIETVVRNLSALLRPAGLLLAADHFHGGWKKNITAAALRELFASRGLKPISVGEGIGGVR
ncbi:MAG: hypothetical protein HXX11_10955 [Desulfuromonadales bacterium]|nr:hypothetical protein [Desulfuromonadales bacterium]